MQSMRSLPMETIGFAVNVVDAYQLMSGVARNKSVLHSS